MFVPVVARLEDLSLDGMFDYGKGFEGVLVGGMGRIQVDLLFGSCSWGLTFSTFVYEDMVRVCMNDAHPWCVNGEGVPGG